MNDTASELKEIEKAEAALAEQREEIERKERECRYKREQAEREAEYLKRVEAEEAMFDAFRQAVGDDLWARAKNGGADCKIVQRQVGRYLSRYTKYEPRLRIDAIIFRGPSKLQGQRLQALMTSRILSNTQRIASHAVSVQSMDEDEKYIADMGLRRLGTCSRRTRQGRIARLRVYSGAVARASDEAGCRSAQLFQGRRIMNQYTVWVTETTQWEVEVEAPDIGSAMRLAEDEVNQVQTNAKFLNLEIEAEDARLDKGVEGGAS